MFSILDMFSDLWRINSQVFIEVDVSFIRFLASLLQVLLSGAKHFHLARRDSSVVKKRSLSVT
jgi:hypothetical protein